MLESSDDSLHCSQPSYSGKTPEVPDGTYLAIHRSCVAKSRLSTRIEKKRSSSVVVDVCPGHNATGVLFLPKSAKKGSFRPTFMPVLVFFQIIFKCGDLKKKHIFVTPIVPIPTIFFIKDIGHIYFFLSCKTFWLQAFHLFI